MRKPTTLLLLLMLLAGVRTSSAQATGKWKVGVQFSKDNYQSNFVSTESWSGYNLEPVSFNYTVGVTGLYELLPKLDLVTGLAYSQKDFTSTYTCAVCKFIVAPTPTDVEQRYLEVPVLVQYRVIDIVDSKLALRLEAGLVNAYRLNKDVGNVDDNAFDNRSLVSTATGVGVSFALSEQLNLSFTGVYKYALKNFSRNAEDNLRSTGLQSGLSYSF